VKHYSFLFISSTKFDFIKHLQSVLLVLAHDLHRFRSSKGVVTSPEHCSRQTNMPPKGPKPTSDELLAQFDDLGLGKSENKTSKPTVSDNAKGGQEDILAELDHLATQRPASGPGTPRLSSDKPRPSTRSPRPSATIERTTEEKAPVRRSEETNQPSRAETKPEQPKAEPENVPAQQPAEESAGWWGGWSGGLFATASAAMKQAEAAVKEIQNNEEAQKWAQQVKGNVGALRDLGMDPPTSTHAFQHAD
jgi:hypothetical protein